VDSLGLNQTRKNTKKRPHRGLESKNPAVSAGFAKLRSRKTNNLTVKTVSKILRDNPDTQDPPLCVRHYYTGQATLTPQEVPQGPIMTKRHRPTSKEPTPGLNTLDAHINYRMGMAFGVHRSLKWDKDTGEWITPPVPEKKYFTNESKQTAKRCKRQCAALLYAAHEHEWRVYLATISFKPSWEVSDTAAMRVCRALMLRFKYIQKKNGGSLPMIRVSERQPSTGVIHFHILVALEKGFSYKKMNRQLRSSVSRYIPAAKSEDVQAWNGLDVVKIALRTGRTVGKYITKMAGRVTTYLTKNKKADRFECMVFSSNYPCKYLPVGFSAPIGTVPLENKYAVNPYVTVFDWRLDFLFDKPKIGAIN
jgi:hypothetical protein